MPVRRSAAQPWSPAEKRVVLGFVRALARGRYRSAWAATRDCLRVLARGPGSRRSASAVHTHIIERAHALGIRWPGVDWNERELEVIRRFARAVATGRQPSGAAAARACLLELGRLGRSSHRRPFKSLHETLMEEAHRQGVMRAAGPWTPAELRVIRRYVRALVAGRFRYVHEAALPCTRELGAMRGRTGPGRRELRTRLAVKCKLQSECKLLGAPRFRSCLTREESGVVERYARAVDRGEFSRWKDAAEACRDELTRAALVASRRRGVEVHEVTAYNLHTIHVYMLDLSRKLALRGPRRILWTEPELRRCASWARWLERHPTRRRGMHAFSEAACGLQDELAEIGHSRSIMACRHRLYRDWRRLRGLPAE